MRIVSTLRYQLLVVPALDHAAVLDHDAPVGHAHGGEAVRS